MPHASIHSLVFVELLVDPKIKEMSSDILPPDSGLIAVALIIRSKDGPRFVFHYPPHPKHPASQRNVSFGTELDQSELEEDDTEEEGSEASDLEDGGFQFHRTLGNLDLNGRPKNGRKVYHGDGDSLNGDDHYDAPNGEHVVPWEHVGEFLTTDLESILTPSRAFHKQKFELSLDPLYFVSYPMHLREDGLWKKKRPRKGKRTRNTSPIASRSSDAPQAGSDESNPQQDADLNSEEGSDQVGMTMFNVVFILQVPKDEEDYRVSDIFEHVIKEFNKALKHAQAQNEYVNKESEMILAMKEKAREESEFTLSHLKGVELTSPGRPMSWLWSHILLKSTLATAIKDIFVAISNNQIATIRVGSKPHMDLSLQIPVPTFLMRIPDPTEKAMPGLLLTTANPMMSEDGIEDPAFLNKHFALLLLKDEDKIISEISADDIDLSAPLIECIKLFKPTLSFLQVAQTNGFELPSILTLAQHLIYWRKAIAIPPLHARDTYIVSPNCDSTLLPTASACWTAAFPLAPSLPSFLADLSAAPRPYKTFAPSTDHRATYLDMLAWLVRGGWVTQLRAFAWILVWPEIVYEVDYLLKSEALEKAQKQHKKHIDASRSPSSAFTSPTNNSSSPASPDSNTSSSFTDRHGPPNGPTPSSSFETSHSDPSFPLTTAQAAEKARLSRLAAKAATEAATQASAFAKRPKPVATDHPSTNRAEHLRDVAPYIIKDPVRVNHVESLYIDAIGKRLAEGKPRECWGRFCGYFNGRTALEGIGLLEGLKRKETWGILMLFQEHLLVVKHW